MASYKAQKKIFGGHVTVYYPGRGTFKDKKKEKHTEEATGYNGAKLKA